MPSIVTTVFANVVSKKKLKEFGEKGTDSENYVLNFRIAAQDSHYDREEKQWVNDEPNFINVSVWGKKAVKVDESIKVGNPVIVHGVMKMKDAWENNEGEEMPPSQYINADKVGIDVCVATGESHRKPKENNSSNSNDESGKSSKSTSSSKSKGSSKKSESKASDNKKSSSDDDFDLDLDLDLDDEDDPGF